MQQNQQVVAALKRIGLSEKEVQVYLALISLGPSAIRKVAERAGINRGTTHELLKALQRRGLVSYFHQQKHQHFVAEDPQVLLGKIARREGEIKQATQEIESVLPQLRALAIAAGGRPTVTYYEDYAGVRSILQDALDSVSKLSKKEYAAYSAATIRPYLYDHRSFPRFTEERIQRKISVRTIAIGAGGEMHGKDERRWLTTEEAAPTYTLLYAGKVAMISLGAHDIPHGLIIEDAGVYKTQLMLFDAMWDRLG